MVEILNEISRTFNEYLFLPGHTPRDLVIDKVSAKAPLCRYAKGKTPDIELNIPVVSAVMQAVSDDRLAVALARQGGLAFIFGSQSTASQAEMVRKVKRAKAGFVTTPLCVSSDQPVSDALRIYEQTGFSILPVTENGEPHSRYLGFLQMRFVAPGAQKEPTIPCRRVMTPASEGVVVPEGTPLSEVNVRLRAARESHAAVLHADGRLAALVFERDVREHEAHPLECIDSDKRFRVGAGINTRDHLERVPALVEAGADVLVIDSSDGYTDWQADCIRWVKAQYGERIKIGAGNVVDGDGFRFLAEAGADFVKVGIGGGSICITREQKGLGRGQASAVLACAAERDRYFQETGVYVPLCSDGGITQDFQMAMALAMGADFVMMGRYFARFDEAPGQKIVIRGKSYKEYWAEGSNRARNWQRYDMGGKQGLNFEEGVDSLVPYAGSLKENVQMSVHKVKSIMVNCGAASVFELRQKARLTIVSPMSYSEGLPHDVIQRDQVSPNLE